MFASLISFFVNIIGNYAFMFGKLGAPALGIGGAAVSTLLVRIVECGITCGYLFFIEEDLRFRPADLFSHFSDLYPEFLRISLPVLGSDMLLSIANSVVMMIVGRMGEAFVAANAVVGVSANAGFVIFAAIGQAAIMTGNTLGEGRIEEAAQQGYAFFGLSVASGFGIALLTIPVCPLMIRIYQLSAATAATTWDLTFALAIINLFQGTNNILTKGVLRGGGDTRC